MMSSRAPFATLSVEPVSTVDRVVEELRRALFEGEIEPGTPLREIALSEALGVARSTVREALGHLVADGLAERIPNRGTVVRDLDEAGIRDLSRARAVLEAAGVERWATASEDARAAVREASDAFTALSDGPASTQELAAAHLAIHRALVGLLESPRLLATADTVYAEIRLALARVDRERRNVHEQKHAHSDLVRLLDSADLDAARAELGRHLDHAERSLLETLVPVTGDPA